MKAEPLPKGKDHALKRILNRNKERNRRAFIRDMQAFAIVTACGITIAAAAVAILCMLMGLPL